MFMSHQVIHIHPEAAQKPAPGESCNGCGVCCLLEPCPLGMALSRRRQGACVAVRWQAETRQYRCGALMVPESVLQNLLSARLQRLAFWLAPGLAWLAKRWIAVGQGCDSTLESHAPLAESVISSTIRHGALPQRAANDATY